VTGTIQIKGRFTCTGKGDGTTVRIYLDGKELWTKPLGGGQSARAQCDVTAQVKAGSLLDIAVDPGPGIQTNNDATNTVVTVTNLP
jgi:hypothetical protein